MVDPQPEMSPQAADARGLSATCARIAGSWTFQGFIYTVIIANAVVIGLGTYEGFEEDHGEFLTLLNELFLAIFVVEIAIRIAAFGRRPQDFFRNGWNVFDFVIVSMGVIPGLRKSATLVRLARLLRVLRLASVRGDLRAVAVGMFRSIPAIGSMLVLVTLLVYFYSMIGWLMFHDEDPEHWGTLGRAMLTLFTVSTLEGWDVILYQAQEIKPMAWVFFVSFVLLISFLVINIVIGILMNSIEQEREAVAAAEREGEAEGRDEVARRLAALNASLTALEAGRAREAALASPAADEEHARVDAQLAELHQAVLALEAELTVRDRDRHHDPHEPPKLLGRRAGRAF